MLAASEGDGGQRHGGKGRRAHGAGGARHQALGACSQHSQLRSQHTTGIYAFDLGHTLRLGPSWLHSTQEEIKAGNRQACCTASPSACQPQHLPLPTLTCLLGPETCPGTGRGALAGKPLSCLVPGVTSECTRSGGSVEHFHLVCQKAFSVEKLLFISITRNLFIVSARAEAQPLWHLQQAQHY